MFDIGFWEIGLILILALLVLGPERLPQAARTVGRWVGKGRRYIEGVKSEVEREFDTGELKRMLHNQEVQIRELQGKLNESADFIDKDYHNMFENKDDPGTDPEPEYDIIEENDEEYDRLEVTPKKSSTEQSPASPNMPEVADESSPQKNNSESPGNADKKE